MLVNLLSYYYRSGLRGSHRATQLVNKFYPLTDVDVNTPYGKINVDLTLSAGQALTHYKGSAVGDVIDKYARGVCYDIGANFGIYSLLMAQKHRVYSFEPNPKIYNHLKKTAEGKSITPYNIAFADYEGESDFFVPDECTMGSLRNWTHDENMSGITSYAGEVSKTVVKVSTMDEFLEKNGLQLPNFIKIDTEGAEVKIFRGGRKTFERSRPVVFFEVSAALWKDMGTSHEEAFEFFDSLGYKLYLGDKKIDNLNLNWEDVLALPNL